MTRTGSADSPADVFVRVNERYRPGVERTLRRLLTTRRFGGARLLRYHLGWENASGRQTQSGGGKMLRPAICLLACEAVRGSRRNALAAAASIELLHNFTLIHDDVEDGSVRRHGRPTVWRVWGEEQAINAGDGMFALAHVAMLDLARTGQPAARVVQALRVLDETTLALCDGQHLDLAESGRTGLTKKAYLKLIGGKTAALLSASAGIGALLGGASERTIGRFLDYGRQLGLAFQVRDDLLGIWGNDATTGKSTSDDLRAGKQTYPVVAARAGAGPSERKALDVLLRKATKSRVSANAARASLERLGARSSAERAARKHAARAVACLPERGLDPRRRRELEALALFAAERDS